ncbi:RNA polymerase sigma factor [Bacillus sp. CECT 9360]|uniref:RNA polymerase sigma factor n=1 Tax=Bacillus sp. CECT 9360 TaxID=2845821 RepID=UPI001E565D1C|nr:RNA polymerase sigma factor [Bacillus sp. CECT 9360]CAH0346796.1 RNA polymerase sigma factor YlaC [Bacillus sp. CECT 9360]
MNENERIIEKWFHDFEADITKYLVYYTGHSDVEDLVQDTFLKALRSFNGYRKESHPKTWLLKIARNTAIDSSKKKSLWKRLQKKQDLTQGHSQLLIEELLISKERYEKLYQAINRLPDHYREVILLRGIAELSPKEAGEVLKWSPNKLNVTFFRAIRKLKKLMEDEENE